MKMLELDGPDGKMFINPLWIVAVIPVTAEKTKFVVARKVVDRNVVETDEHTIDMSYDNFMQVIVSTVATTENKLTLG